MTESQVIALINQWIIANGNNEITADVLRPILLAMVGQPNDVTGDLSDLSTGANTNLVAAINWLNTQISGITGNYITLHQGNDDPNVTPPSTFSQGDFYLERLLDNTPIQLWQYNIDGWKLVVAGAGDQDNQITPISIEFETSTNVRQSVVDAINALPSFNVTEKQIPIFTANELDNGLIKTTSRWQLAFIGKGTYGVGGTPVTTNTIVNVSPPQALSLVSVPPGAIQITISGTGTPESVLNAVNPPVFIGANSDVTTIITTDAGVYWWLGSEGTYGVGGDTAVAGDFQLLPGEVEYVTQEQLDEAVTGLVPYTGATESVDLGDYDVKAFNYFDSQGNIVIGEDGTVTTGSVSILKITGVNTDRVDLIANNVIGTRLRQLANADGVEVLSVNSQTANTSGAITLTASDIGAASEDYVNDQISAATVNLWDDRGTHSASGGAYPTTGGSGTSGAILKGDTWTISVAGTLPSGQVVEVGDVIRALIDAPGNTQANWAIQQNNIGYTAENSANKETSTIVGNETSIVKYPAIKAVVDWVTSLFGTLSGGNTWNGVQVFNSLPTLPGVSSNILLANGAQTSGHTYVQGRVLGSITPGNAVINTGDTIQVFANKTQGQIDAINASMPRQLKDFYTDVSNVGTTETDLYSYTIPANTLSANGQKIVFEVAGITGSDTFQFGAAVKFGSATAYQVGGFGYTVGLPGLNWSIKTTIIRTGTTTARAITKFSTGLNDDNSMYARENIKYTDLTGLNFATTNILKMTGSSGTASNDITAKMGNIVWHPAAP